PNAVADSDDHPVPADFQLRAYPNPFNRSVTIRFTLDRPGELQWHIVNIMGREVYHTDNSFPAGTHTVTWTPDSALSGGIYFIQLQSSAGARKQIRKIVYLK
ncbi:T9SS type A sorting domain-containing protein, partial [bacterium]|nr:T9SS type A sorting domain-containing protein [bacterium]